MEINARYYTVKEIKQLEHCGRDKAYEIARQLPHEIRGRDIYVFADSYEEYYKQKKERAEGKNVNLKSNVYSIRKFS